MLRLDVSGLNELRARMRKFSRREVETALRNTINDTARDVQKREEDEVAAVFDRPTPIVRRAFFVRKASRERLEAEVRIKDVFGNFGQAIPNTLEPHIPGFPATRNPKGMERALQRRGLMRRGQYLVPSRTMRLNRYGNVPGSTASKMLNDLGVFRGIAGFNSSTGEAKTKYLWGTASGVTGIWLRTRFQRHQPGALQMLVVNTQPTYRKRFKFYQVGRDHAAKVMPNHARDALAHAYRRAGMRGRR